MNSSNYDNGEILRKPFDIETHKKAFINYCEVVILEDGTIEYAVPSHEQKLLAVAAKKLNMSTQEIIDATCGPYALYWYEILSYATKCMQVSNASCRFFFEPNSMQMKSLQKLAVNGLVDFKIFESVDANVRAFWRFMDNNSEADKVIHFFDK